MVGLRLFEASPSDIGLYRPIYIIQFLHADSISLTPPRARHPTLWKLLWRKLVTLLSACSGRNYNFRCINVVFCVFLRARWLRAELTFNNDLRTPTKITRSWWTEGGASCLQFKMSKLKRKPICQRRVKRYAPHSISRRRWFRGWQITIIPRLTQLRALPPQKRRPNANRNEERLAVSGVWWGGGGGRGHNQAFRIIRSHQY